MLCLLVIIEMLADKVPAVNHVNDLIQTLIRPAAGAIAFAASANVVTDVSPVLALACGLARRRKVHVAKAGAVRPMVTATTGGAGKRPRFHRGRRRFHRSIHPGDHRADPRWHITDRPGGVPHLLALQALQQETT